MKKVTYDVCFLQEGKFIEYLIDKHIVVCNFSTSHGKRPLCEIINNVPVSNRFLELYL